MFKHMKNKSIIGLMFLLVALLTGCGSKTESKPNKTTNLKMRMIKTDMGEIEIPSNPKRVVVTVVQGDVLALDLVPVGTSFNTGGVFEKYLEDSTVINAFDLNPEEIMSLNPDLIIWNGSDKEAHKTLSKIAPTITQDLFAMDYQNRLRFLGDVLNKSDKAEELIKDFEEKIENSIAKLKENGLDNKTALCMENREDVLSVSWLGRGGPLMYETLGFSLPEKLAEEAKKPANEQQGGVKLSYEVMDQYAADVMVINGDLGKFGDTAVWKNLAAVKSEQVVYAPSNMFWFNDILSLNAQIDLIMDSLIK